MNLKRIKIIKFVFYSMGASECVCMCVVIQDVPPYNFHGSLDDSLQNLRKVIPVPPRRDYVKYMDNFGKLLRYEAKLVTAHSSHLSCCDFVLYHAMLLDYGR